MGGKPCCRVTRPSATSPPQQSWRSTRPQSGNTSDRYATPNSERVDPTMQMTEQLPASTAGWGQKAVMLAGTLIPFVGFVAAVALLWNTAVSWIDLVLLAVLYVLCGFGITINNQHKHTHSAFE